MEAEVFDLDMKLISNSLNSLSDCSKDAEEEDSMESLLFDLDDEDNDFVIDDLATLIILIHLVVTGEIDGALVINEGKRRKMVPPMRRD